ncbi:TPA: hypothetical protein MM161_004889 [Klebsiella pneumoniae]|nr:hypothetical protein [Klebsiella pneumoniae]
MKSDREIKHASNLANALAGHACAISFAQGDAPCLKTTLLEASHHIDTNCVQVTPKKDGLLIRTLRGEARYMNWRERIAYWLLRGKTEIHPRDNRYA